MISGGDERAMLARIDHLERQVAALTAYIRERALATDPAAGWSGTAAELALRRLADLEGPPLGSHAAHTVSHQLA